MGNALLSGVSGLRVHQKMLDVAGNNLANINTLAFKSSRVTFAELLSETLREGSQPTATTGGMNPIQVGSGATLAGVDRLMTQGGLTSTGQSLDLAIEGKGYFVLNSGTEDAYTRAGAFAVDSENYLGDPSTGYRVQRIGNEGVADGFQTAGDDNVRVPYNQTLPAKATTEVTMSGNLSADTQDATTSLLTSGTVYTASGAPASTDTLLTALDQTDTLAVDDEITIKGTNKAGTTVDTAYTISNLATNTLGNLLAAISTAFTGSTASIVNGEIQLKDDAAGYSQANLELAYVDDAGADGTFELPNYFSMLGVGSQGMYSTDVEIFDSQGIGHVMSAAFARTLADPNKWDLVLTSISGGVEAVVDRRMEDIEFLVDGSFGGMSGSPADAQSLQIKFSNDPTTTRTIAMDLGTVGEYNGVSLSGGSTTVSARGQDGYSSGQLSSLAVSGEGVLVGLFTNGIRKDIAAIKLATFQNPGGLVGLGNNYYESSGNSGEPVPTKGLSGGAGTVRGGVLEGSNVEVAAEFVSLIQAQNGFQASARTIRVANEILRELANVIR